MGARIIEKHFTINKKSKGPDISCSMDSKDLKDLLYFSNIVHSALKKKDDFIKEENITRNFAFHSVVSKESIEKGNKLNLKNLTVKRPGTGYFPASKLYSLIGKKAKRFIEKNRLIKKKDV